MDPSITVSIVALLLLAEGFFSASEFALISYNRIKLRHLAESGQIGAETVLQLLKKPDKIFGTTSIGTNLCVFASASIATAFLAQTHGERADIYSFLIMGPATLVLGEIVPKMLARHHLIGTIPYIARPLVLFQNLFRPVLWVTSTFSKILLKVLLSQDEIPSPLVTRDEILRLTKISEEKLDLDQDEKKMISRIFEFKKTTVDESMQPLINLVAVSNAATLAEAKARIAETGVSRLPVFTERIFNIVGVISAFDILRQRDLNMTVDKIMSQALYIPMAKRNAVLLKEMLEKDAHMAVVVDEYGAAAGIVTVEDLVEEIVGEIEDEYDNPVKLYEKRGEGRYIIDSMMEIDSVNDELGLALPKGDYETVSGLITDILERIPAKREKLAVGPYLITVLDTSPQKTLSVELLDLSNKDETDGKPDQPKS